MSTLRDKFFWASYGKFAAATVAGLAIATFVLGVPADVTIRLGIGALLAFPAAFGFAIRRPTGNSAQPQPPVAA